MGDTDTIFAPQTHEADEALEGSLEEDSEVVFAEVEE